MTSATYTVAARGKAGASSQKSVLPNLVTASAVRL